MTRLISMKNMTLAKQDLKSTHKNTYQQDTQFRLNDLYPNI